MLFSAQAQQQSDLESIQLQIKAKQAQIEKELNKAKKLQQDLKKVELDVALAAKKLNSTKASLKQNRAEQKQLSQQQKGYLNSLEQQKSVLAKQIRSAYMTGNYEFAKMLLNQQDAANFERTITYYQYLNKARKEQIDSFNALILQLQQVNAKLLDNQQQLVKIQAEQVNQQNALQASLTEREATLNQIRSTIESEEAQIAQLQINEKNLAEALARAQQQAKKQNIQLDGLSALKGRLLKPVKGTLRKMFGRFRQGQVKWKGVVIYGTSGDTVVAIHDAKVLYSDWLRGFGLVTVLDHGDGYMSLYGHNQALLKQAGETVQAGEAVALLGQSGGQSRPNLYFEIRHKGVPINPTLWLKL
ncbi:murein hydrolase activator EnvC family protein [Paraglaciecola aestuariivivens]